MPPGDRPRLLSDPLDGADGAGLHWTTSNLGEAMPGVLTPLGWSVWDEPINRGAREGGYLLGVFTRTERRNLRCIEVFHGRVAFAVERMAMIGDRMPGTSAAEAVSTFFEATGIPSSPTRRRYPIVAWRAPVAFARFPRRMRAVGAAVDEWWRSSVAAANMLDGPAALDLLDEAYRWFDHAVCENVIGAMTGAQPAYEAVKWLVHSTGAGDLAELSAPSGAVELQMVTAIWRASRGEVGVDDIVRDFGFHGPLEGEVSGRVWREDAAPLRRMVEHYATLDADQDPRLRDRERRARRPALERAVIDAVPVRSRPAARLVLRFVREVIPLRGVSKRATVQALDVVRLAARRTGVHLADQGLLDQPDDVFHLTLPELRRLPGNARDLVAHRRARREHHRAVALPERWVGNPVPTVRSDPTSPRAPGRVLSGLGIGGGVVEGVARVVEHPDFAEVEPGEILVSPTTDPSWAPIMFVSGGLVVDIGGPMGHAAIVARELGIPCVIATGSGSRALRTGDRIRVDGDAGTVHLIAPVDAPRTEVAR